MQNLHFWLIFPSFGLFLSILGFSLLGLAGHTVCHWWVHRCVSMHNNNGQKFLSLYWSQNSRYRYLIQKWKFSINQIRNYLNVCYCIFKNGNRGEGKKPWSMLNFTAVVAQLVERSLPIPEVRGSNPVIRKNYIENLFTFNCIEKT